MNFRPFNSIFVIGFLFLSATLFHLCLNGQRLHGQEWNQFRGPNSSGIYSGKELPSRLDDSTKIWSIALPKGHSSPVISGDNLIVTGFVSESNELQVLNINRRTGKLAWQKRLPVQKFEKGHPSFNPASSTPATDGEFVVTYFGSYGLCCFDMTGKRLWERKMPVARSYAGNATSPIIARDKVILYRGNLVDHYVVAIDKRNGKQVWKQPQDEPFALELACTACPIIKRDQLLLHSARSVQSLQLDSGNLNWVIKCATTATSTPILSDDKLIVAAWNKMGEPALRPEFPTYKKLLVDHDGNADQKIEKSEFPTLWIFHRPEGIEAPENGAPLRFRSVDTNRDGVVSEAEWNNQLKKLEAFRSGYKTHGILSIPIESEGEVGQDDVKTLVKSGIPEVPSPLVKDGRLYFVKNGGLLSCFDLQDGKMVYRKRLRGKGTYYSSPVIANDYLFTFAGDGKYAIVRLGDKGEVIHQGDLGEPVYATPAVQDGVIYVRTHQRLIAFGKH